VSAIIRRPRAQQGAGWKKMLPAAANMERAVVAKTYWRIIPLCFILYIFSYINRANIAYAALHMNQELGLSAEAFGLASGLFFIGYFLVEVPSNMALLRFGPRLWITRILVSWGIVSAATAFVQTPMQFYMLRFLLGAAEAGFFPGILIYLSMWFRAKERATTVSLFTAAIPVSYLIAAPISTWLMAHVSGWGYSGWRWMLFLESLPALFGGVVCWFVLTDRPAQAKWLSQPERDWLAGELEKDAAPGRQSLGTFAAITNPRVLYLVAIYFIYQCGSLGIGYWLPLIIRGLNKSLSDIEIGLVAMLPYAVAAIGMILWSRRSDATGERRFHAAFPLLVAGLALGALVLTHSIVLSLLFITVSLTGMYAFKAPFWALPGLFLSRSTAAISIAAINCTGNLGGFAGPYLIGFLKERSGSAITGLVVLAALTLVAALMTFLIRLENRDA
jgi:ACS family tartrate transporter-like MFS transporter